MGSQIRKYGTTEAGTPIWTAQKQLKSTPGDVQRRLLREGVRGQARPQSHKHQGDGDQQLSHQRQPVTLRAQYALQEQPIPLLPVQPCALQLIQLQAISPHWHCASASQEIYCMIVP